LGTPPGARNTGEALVNAISDAPSLPTTAGYDPATEFLSHPNSWLGLATATEQLDVALDSRAVARLVRYRELLVARNQQVNLTAIRDPDEIERRLFLDALAMLPALDAFVSQLTPREQPFRLIDVGSGGGFPGLALKIARPDLDVTLVDATAKKVAFLNDVIADLDLPGAQAVHGRAEELGHDANYRERFDLATARAVATLPVLFEYVIPFLRVPGAAFLPKGLAIDEELRAGRRAARALGATVLSADPLPVASTRLVIAHKTAPTPATYPRRTGVPSRAPLGEGSLQT
jgi:16S rRNA (guanine527-N7)-methyltransferase